MKRSLATFFILAGLIAMPLRAQVRIDVGFDLPRGVGAIVSGQPEISSEVSDALSQYVIPFPEAGLYYQYQFSGAPVRIGDAFRIGGGAIAFASPDIPDGIAFAYYLGLKFAIKF